MEGLGCVTINVNGIREPPKRHAFLQWLSNLRPHFVCLQEAHILSGDLEVAESTPPAPPVSASPVTRFVTNSVLPFVSQSPTSSPVPVPVPPNASVSPVSTAELFHSIDPNILKSCVHANWWALRSKHRVEIHAPDSDMSFDFGQHTQGILQQRYSLNSEKSRPAIWRPVEPTSTLEHSEPASFPF